MSENHTQIKTTAYLNKLEVIQQQLISKYDSLGKKHHFNTLLVLLLLRHETAHNEYDYDYHQLQQMVAAASTLQTYDLLPCYQEVIAQSGKNYKAFYWTIDAHHNSSGYKMMAECIADYLLTDTTLAH